MVVCPRNGIVAADAKNANELKEEEKNKYLRKTELYLKIAQEAQRQLSNKAEHPDYLPDFYRCLSFALYWIEEYRFQNIFLYLSTTEDFKFLVGRDQVGLVSFISYGDSIRIRKLENIES